MKITDSDTVFIQFSTGLSWDQCPHDFYNIPVLCKILTLALSIVESAAELQTRLCPWCWNRDRSVFVCVCMNEWMTGPLMFWMRTKGKDSKDWCFSCKWLEKHKCSFKKRVLWPFFNFSHMWIYSMSQWHRDAWIQIDEEAAYCRKQQNHCISILYLHV